MQFRIGKVKNAQGRGQILPVNAPIEAPAHGGAGSEEFPGRSPDPHVKFPRGRQHGVTHCFKIQPAPGIHREQAILGVHARGIVRTNPTKRRGGHQALDMLQRPVVPHQFRSKEIEQAGMGRPLATGPEVAVGPHQALLEVSPPDPIHDHPGSKRILPVREFPGQGQPPRSPAVTRSLPAVQNPK